MNIQQALKILILITMFISPLSFAKIVVIANQSVAFSSLTEADIYHIYLGKIQFLPDGEAIFPIDQPPGSPIRKQFYLDFFNWENSQMETYWSRVMFSGQGIAPIVTNDDRAVIALVTQNPKYIGYIDNSSLDGSVKIVFP